METLFVILCFVAAAGYLYRKNVRTLKAKSMSCGCGECGGCPTAGPSEAEPSVREEAQGARDEAERPRLRVV